MKKPLLTIAAGLLLSFTATAQENNPLINSGEIIKEAVARYDEGKYKEAISLYKKINRSDTNYVYAMYELALTYGADSQFNEAMRTCEMALAEKMDAERWPDLLTQYASMIDNIGQPERALVVFDSALRVYPAYSALYLNKGTTLMRMKRYDEAEAVFRQNILIDPYAASSHYKMGVVALQSGRLIPAMLCFIDYLWVLPDGRYSNNCISLLSAIANYKPDIQEYVTGRKEEAPEEYKLAEQIITSKIALDKNFKPAIDLDDAISRQIQVLFEKLEYQERSTDFYMQYYVPAFKQIFSSGKFESFINYIFSGVNLKQIQDYNKKKKKEVEEMNNQLIVYFNKIRSTRVLALNARNVADTTFYYNKGLFSGKGKATADNKFTGKWTYYYPGGNIKSSGILNSKEDQEGPWTYYYPDGRVKGKQTFTAGQLNGEEAFYFRNGNPSSIAQYTGGDAKGESSSYYYTGSVNNVSHYDKGKLNGERKHYFSNGMLQGVEQYSNDQLNGPFVTYFKNGMKESEGTYLNGELNGAYKLWFTNGKLSMDCQYSKNNPAGIWKDYHDNGQLKTVRSFNSDGKIDGEFTEYYDNGQQLTKCMYKKGKVDGDVAYADRDGKIFSTYSYNNDKLKSIKYFDKWGKTLSSAAESGNKIKAVTYTPNGVKLSEVTYDEKGLKKGTETFYYYSGAVSQVNEYRDGELNGKCVNYYSNGQKSLEVNYDAGKKNGYYKTWYFHGALQEEGWYVDGDQQGLWLEYDALGNISARNYYLNGELHGYKEEFYPNGKKEYDTKYVSGWLTELVQYDTTGKEMYRCNLEKGSGRYAGVYFNGKPHFEGTFVNGDFNGPYRFSFYDGSLFVQTFYKKGLADSIYKSYYYGGKPGSEGQYKFGLKTGPWKSYRADGKLSNLDEYVDGSLNGLCIEYFGNGKPRREMMYKDNDRHGLTKKYDPTGNLVYQIRYEAGDPVAYSYLGKDGKLVPEIPMNSGNVKMRSFYSNGSPSAEYDYKDGKVNGPTKTYFPNGKTWEEAVEENSDYHGVVKEYFPSGQLSSSRTFWHDNLHGPYKIYTEKGTVKEEGNYHIGNYHGNVYMYDDNGKLTATYVYYYGKLLNVKK